jgi:hypothetical protein
LSSRDKAGYAHRIGKLVSPGACDCCLKQDAKLNKYHIDYDKPLKVLWLCWDCLSLMNSSYPVLDKEVSNG